MKNTHEKIEQLYKEALIELAIDERYGHVLEENPMYHDIFHNLFVAIMSDERVFEMMEMLNEYDRVTFLHSLDVFLLTCLMSIQMDIYDIHFIRGGLLHDIGKLHIPLDILGKAGRLTHEEFEVIKTHTTIGCAYLKEVGFKEESLLARHHHERMDGSGYPDGLKESKLTKQIRLLGILDVYSALTLKRPYKKAFDNEQAFDIMLSNTSFYDLGVLNGFMETILKNPNAYSKLS